jgi:hypothetical protein
MELPQLFDPSQYAVEMWWNVARFLPLDSQVRMGLSCRHLRVIIFDEKRVHIDVLPIDFVASHIKFFIKYFHLFVPYICEYNFERTRISHLMSITQTATNTLALRVVKFAFGLMLYQKHLSAVNEIKVLEEPKAILRIQYTCTLRYVHLIAFRSVFTWMYGSAFKNPFTSKNHTEEMTLLKNSLLQRSNKDVAHNEFLAHQYLQIKALNPQLIAVILLKFYTKQNIQYISSNRITTFCSEVQSQCSLPLEILEPLGRSLITKRQHLQLIQLPTINQTSLLILMEVLENCIVDYFELGVYSNLTPEIMNRFCGILLRMIHCKTMRLTLIHNPAGAQIKQIFDNCMDQLAQQNRQPTVYYITEATIPIIE